MGNFSTCPFREKLIFNHDFKSQAKSASQPVYREPVQGMTSNHTLQNKTENRISLMFGVKPFQLKNRDSVALDGFPLRNHVSLVSSANR